MTHPKVCFGQYDRAVKAARGCIACIYASRCVPSREDLSEHIFPQPVDYELPEPAPVPVRSKYHREIRATAIVDGREIKVSVWLDFYDIAKGWDVRCPALQHLLKKVLAPGERGHKTKQQDLQDIVDSAIRAKELEA